MTLIPQRSGHLKVLGSRVVSKTTWPCPGGRAARILAASSPIEPIMTSGKGGLSVPNCGLGRPHPIKHSGVQLIGFHMWLHQTKQDDTSPISISLGNINWYRKHMPSRWPLRNIPFNLVRNWGVRCWRHISAKHLHGHPREDLASMLRSTKLDPSDTAWNWRQLCHKSCFDASSLVQVRRCKQSKSATDCAFIQQPHQDLSFTAWSWHQRPPPRKPGFADLRLSDRMPWHRWPQRANDEANDEYGWCTSMADYINTCFLHTILPNGLNYSKSEAKA